LLRIGLKPSEQADRALLRRTTIGIAQRFEGPKDVTASVRKRQRTAGSVGAELAAASVRERHSADTEGALLLLLRRRNELGEGGHCCITSAGCLQPSWPLAAAGRSDSAVVGGKGEPRGLGRPRFLVVRISPAAARPRPIILKSIIPSVAKIEKTTPITSAAL
jgi:hypothetical protein